jgi:hypothetical protein
VRGRIEQRMTNFSGGVRRVDATLGVLHAGAGGKVTTAGGQASGTKGKREELLDARNMVYDRRTGLLRRRNPHVATISLNAAKITSLMPGSGFTAGAPKQMLASDGANIYDVFVTAPVLAGLTANSLWHSVMFPASGGQGPLWMMNGTEARYWTGAAGAAWTASTGTLPIGKYLAAHGNRVWSVGMVTLAGVSDPKSAYAWSDIGDARSWPAANVNMLDPTDGGELTGIGRVGPYLLLFKRNKTWLVYDLDTGANRQLSASIGCISHRSIVETPRGTFFMSDRGPAICDGSEIRLIDDKLNLIPLIDLTDTQINLTRQVHAVYLNDDIYLNIGQYDPPPGTSHLEYDLSQYDVINDAWWPHSKPMAAMAVWDNNGKPEVFGVDHGGNPGSTTRTLIRLFSPSIGSQYGTDWDGAELTCSFRLRDLDFDSDGYKRLRAVSVEANAYLLGTVYADGVSYSIPGRDLTSATGVQRAVLPRPAAAPRMRRIGVRLGGWPTTVPAPTVGIAFTVPKTGPALISTTASAYVSVAGNSISIDVYLDGVLAANMAMNASIPTATHMMATPAVIARNLTRGTHYVAYRQVSGTSDASDIGAVSVVQP